MKKRYLFIQGAKRWNSLLNQFTKIQKKMQNQTGLKTIGLLLTFIFFSFASNAQFAAGQFLQAGGINIDIGRNSNPTFADLDNDGDLDLYIGEYDGAIKVFINDGTGVFTAGSDLVGSGAYIDVGAFSSPTLADIDGDNDLDLYVGEYVGSIKVFNNANGVFTAVANLQADGTVINTGLNTNPVPTFADLDGDNDLDLYVGDWGGTINVFINTGGVFSAMTDLEADNVTIDVGSYSAPAFADLDNDGDLDLYVGASDGTINVFTNNAGVFTATSDLQAGGANIDVGHYSTPIFEDGDGDGDLDLYVGEFDGTITFYENTTISQSVGIQETDAPTINIYPNPVQDQLFIELEDEQVRQLTILDLSGKIVQTNTHSTQSSIDVSELTEGIYILQVHTKNGVTTNRFLKK